MKTLLLTLLLSTSAFANVTAGYLQGHHLDNSNLNNAHPFLEIDNVLIYRNSFNKTSLAAFYKAELGIFSLRYGVTSGYGKDVEYRGLRCKDTNILGVTPFIVPAIEYDTGSVTYIASLMLNSINIGLGVHF